MQSTMEPPRRHQEYPYAGVPEGQSYQQGPSYGVSPVIASNGENNSFQWGYYMHPTQYPTYYHGAPRVAYSQPMGPMHGYGGLMAAQDPSVLCYSYQLAAGNGAHPVPMYQPQFMGVLPEFHHNMYINSNFPPQIHHYPHGGVAHITAVPPLDHRRNSCSSADSVAAPQTPSLGSTCADSATPSIEGEFQHGMPFSPMEAPGQKKVPGQVRYPTDYTRNSLYNPSKTSNVYVRGLVPETNDETLLKLVQPYGTVAQHKAIINKETGFCKGYGFARFETIDEAKSCILSMAKYNLDAGFARESFNSRLKSLRDPSSTNLYVSNLPPSVDEAKMKEIFKDFWVNSARILRDAQGVSRGVGFVRLGNHDVCNQVIEMFNDRVVVEGEPAIQVRYADTHAQKNLKETTARVREFYCNEQKKVLGKVPAQVKGVPMGPRNDGGKRWAGGRKIISKPAGDRRASLASEASLDDNASDTTVVPAICGNVAAA